MATINVEPFVYKNADLIIAEDDFAAACSTIELAPSSSTVQFKGLKKTAVFTDVTAATWVLNLTFAQDWKNEGSLSRYLYENEGSTVSAVIKPQSEEEPAFEVDIIITPGAVGGAVDGTATATVSLGVVGRPELVDLPVEEEEEEPGQG